MKAPLYSKEGKKKGEIVLNPEIYGVKVNRRLLQIVLRAYAANLRHGTHDTKTRKEVRGGGKKPWKQKGTGRARHGSIRSPIWKGGGTVFGPHPRDYFTAVPTGMRKRALIAALSLRAAEKNLILLEDTKLETPKTKEWMEIVRAMPLHKKRALCVIRELEPNLRRASRNVSKWVELQKVKDLNAYHILQKEKLLIQQEALPLLENRLLEVVREGHGTEGVKDTA